MLILICQQAKADSYQFTDSAGTIHVVDSLDKVPAEQREKAAVLLRPISKVPARVYDQTRSPAHSGASLEIFVADWCGVCRALEKYLHAKGISYNRRDIEKSSSARKEFERMGGGGIPVIKAGTKTIRGFDRAQVDQLLGFK